MKRVAAALPLLTFFVAIFTPFMGRAQEAIADDSPEGKVISSISIQYLGAPTVDENRVRLNMTLREGSPFTREAARQDAISLRENKIVEFVDIVPEVQGNRVRVVVFVMATGTLGEIVFEGNTRFDDGELLREVKAEVGQPVDDDQLLEGKFNIEELYREKGFSDVSVTYRTTIDPETGFTRAVYGVVEGESNKLRNIYIQGASAMTQKELRKVMKTKQRGIWSRITGSNKIDSFILEEDKAQVERALQNKGYMDARVVRHELQRIEAGSEYVDLFLIVQEGMPYTVSDVRIGGNERFSNAELSSYVKMAPGELYSLDKIQADAQRIEDHFGRQGYADARVNTRIDSVGGQQVRISHLVREGQISHIRKININGMDYTKDEVIRRELLIQPGEVFNTVKLRQSKSILENTRFFSEVEVTPEDTGQPGYKDININVTEGKTGSFQVGAAFTSVENVFGYLSFTESNFDIANWTRLPPRGDGQKFQFNLRWGTRTKDFLIGFTEPWFLGQRLALGGELYWREQLFLSSEYSQRMAGGAIWLRRPINNNTRFQIEYRLQQVQVYDLDDDELLDRDGDGIRETFIQGVSPEIAAEEGSFLESKLSFEILQDTRDSNTLPRTGHRWSIAGALSGGFLGGEVDTYDLSASFTQHVSLPFDTIFTFHSEVNIADTWAGGDRVPIFNRHFLGGAYNLRGFRFRDVGPVDSEDEPLGGGTSAYTTLEYSFPIMERLRGSAFMDAGFVNADAYDFTTSELNVDVGLGIRLEVPGFGPMRLDYGVPVKRSDHQGSSGRINFLLDYRF